MVARESLCEKEVACSASDCQGTNFETCVWRAVSSNHPLGGYSAQSSLYVYKGGLKLHLFHFFFFYIVAMSSYEHLTLH